MFVPLRSCRRMDTEDHSSDDLSCSAHSANRNSTNSTTKAGRKGDPRMHRAVSARFSNPKVSLFEALKLGGFDYPNDEDANVLDAEQITLGQRKNQLSRRIRLMQKQNHFRDHDSENDHSTNSAKPRIQLPNKLTSTLRALGNMRQFGQTEDDGLADDPATRVTESTKVSAEDVAPRIMAKDHPAYRPSVVPLLPQTASTNEIIVAQRAMLQRKDVRKYNLKMTPGDQEVIPRALPQVGLRNAQNSACFEASPTHVKLSALAAAGGATGPFSSNNSDPYAQHPTPSGLAISSLSQTAASIGMTLEQLALALRSSNNLAKTLLPSLQPSQSQKDLAVALYQGENRVLYQRAMLLAGYNPEVAQNERSPHHLQFALSAWQLEGERLQVLANESEFCGEDPPLEPNVPSVAMAAPNYKKKAKTSVSEFGGLPREHSLHEHSHTDHDGECAYENGRHIHRLEGKCGHRPILHQPVGGTPHIDFVVGDRVECYHGVQPSQDLLWPSSYKCEDLSCSDSCRDDALERILKGHEHMPPDCMLGNDPKVYDRSELDFEGEEWNLDFSNSETLLGLFKLGDTQLESSRSSDCA